MHNLPVELNSFVGRERELEELRNCLGKTRLLTLTGTGGAGKTRLALRLAASVVAGYPDGVWLISLGPVCEDGLLPQAVASVLDVRERSGESLVDSVCRYLGERRMLIVLDSCEHLVDACARLVEAMLASCPKLMVLTTSQEALRVPGELVWRVPSLSLPTDGGDARPAALMASEAVRLFVERAALVQRGFTIKEHNGRTIARICRRLDGLPLALELAAAQIRLMPPDELETRLQDRFRLLTGGSRTAVARQQTLHATVEWSYGRLDPCDQALFRRLAVFSGSFDLDAVEAICADPPVPQNVPRSLSQLVDRSMVGVQTGGQAGRYKLLETLRQYGQERLAENGEGDVRRLHAQYYAAMAQRASNPLAVVEDGYLMRLELEQDNLRTALAWALTNDREVALQIAAALSPPHWHLRGSLRERHQWLAEVTATSCAPSAALARALTSAGWVAFWEGDYEQSRALADQGLRIARDLGAASEVALAVNLRGVLFHVVDEDLEAARRWYAEAYEIRSELNDRRGMASTLSNLALLEYDAGALEVAESLAREAVAQLDEAAGRLTLGGLWDNLARIVLDRGRPAESRRHHRANLMLAQELDNKADIADALDGLARVAAAEGEPERALMIAGASYALHDRIGYEIHKPWRRRLKTSIDSARAAIRPEEADAAWERGARLSEREAVLVALGSPTEAAEDSADVAKVTAREREVAALIAAGLSNKEIGNRLTISERTVESHIEHIRSKLQVRSRAEIAVWATRIGLAPSAVVTAAR